MHDRVIGDPTVSGALEVAPVGRAANRTNEWCSVSTARPGELSDARAGAAIQSLPEATCPENVSAGRPSIKPDGRQSLLDAAVGPLDQSLVPGSAGRVVPATPPFAAASGASIGVRLLKRAFSSTMVAMTGCQCCALQQVFPTLDR